MGRFSIFSVPFLRHGPYWQSPATRLFDARSDYSYFCVFRVSAKTLVTNVPIVSCNVLRRAALESLQRLVCIALDHVTTCEESDGSADTRTAILSTSLEAHAAVKKVPHVFIDPFVQLSPVANRRREQ